MLKLSKKVEYALIALKHMSELRGDDLASAREIAEQYHVPYDILGKVMQSLNRADLVESIQGARGGYRLRLPLSEVTLGQVIEAIDGPVQVVPCAGDHYSCRQESSCNIKKPINQLQSQLQTFVFSLTLDTLHGSTQDLPFHFSTVDTMT
mgnify:CR=1 FL=1|tara:strand:+ start:147 stop:596 length:450 start_codon:yes stop_codon:yes gene_type:complete